MCIHLTKSAAEIVADLPHWWEWRFNIELKRLCVLAIAVGGLAGAADAQTTLQLRPHSAWDGLGPDPSAARSISNLPAQRRLAGQKPKSTLNSTVKQPNSSARSAFPLAQDAFEESIEQDQENQKLKRAMEICKRC